MSTASVTPGNSRTGVVDPPNQEQQQPQITAVTNGGVSIVPNSISDGPLVHMGMHFSLFPFGLCRYNCPSRTQGALLTVAGYWTFGKMVRLILQVRFRRRMPER